MKKLSLSLVFFVFGIMAFSKNATLTLVVAGKTTYTTCEEGSAEIVISDIKGEVSKITGFDQFPNLEKLVLNSVSFAKNMRFEKDASKIKTLVMKFCSFYSLDFLTHLPSLEAVYAPFSVTRFTPLYEIDLAKSEKLVFFYMTHMQRNIQFKRIKALPPSLEVFSTTDAIFDMDNLRTLRDVGGGKLIYGLDSYTAKKVADQGLEFAVPATYQKYDKIYHLGMK